MRYSFRLAARVLLYAPSHRQDKTYHGLCYTSRGAHAGTRNSNDSSNVPFNRVDVYTDYLSRPVYKLLLRVYIQSN